MEEMENNTKIKKTTKARSKKRKKIVEDHFKEYCKCTSIHGFKYLGEDITLIERIWWIILICFCICLCGFMIYQIIYKYIHYPVIVTFSMTEMRLQQLPFPAVTICPRAKISQTYFNLTEFFDKMYKNVSITEEEQKRANIASTICEYDVNNVTSQAADIDFYNFILESKTDIFHYCEYQGIEIDCKENFTPILTEEGICHSFNILDKHDIHRNNIETAFENFHRAPPTEKWDLEDGYITNEIKLYPRRALRVGLKNSLNVILKTHVNNIEFQCASDESGYRVTIDLPSNIPEVSENYITIPLQHRVTGAIVPRVIKTSDGVKSYDVSKRECYFESERSLKFYKKYSQQNCLLECKTNYTLKECGCVGIHMPKEPGTPLCLLMKQVCMYNAEELFSLFNEDLAVSEDMIHSNNYPSCDCKPTCTAITYNTELSYNNLILELLNKSLLAELDFEHHTYSLLDLYFKSSYVETKERNELYGFSDVISNFGGLLGLFTGFSILSFIEIIYFLTLRLWKNLKLRHIQEINKNVKK